MKLTENNYFSPEANLAYMSVSQFKQFWECPAAAMAQIQGEWDRPMTKALLEGSYVDAYFSGTMERFLIEHNEVLNSRTGKLKAEYAKADRAIEAAEQDPFFMRHLEGEKQVIMTGELFGLEWKIKVDSLQDDKIVDFKYMKDMAPVWSKGERKTFVDAYHYDIQGYVYREVVEQNTGKKLPFYLAVMTKEEPSDRDVIEIPDWKLNSAGEIVKYYAPVFEQIKNGEAEATRCERCAYCRETKKLTKVRNYEELIDMEV